MYSSSEMAAKLSRFSAMERMMKLQDVLLKAMAKKITWWEAAEIIGVTDRTMRRWRERLEEHGYSGLADRRKGKVSFRRVPLKTCEEVLRLYREEVLRFQHSSLSREAAKRARNRVELYVGATGAAKGGLREAA
jgi:hypothetical protein